MINIPRSIAAAIAIAMMDTAHKGPKRIAPPERRRIPLSGPRVMVGPPVGESEALLAAEAKRARKLAKARRDARARGGS